jgi:hypothetical protein
MEDRETFEIVTPVKGHVVVLRSWITGRESQKIDGAMFKGVGTTQDGKRLTPKLSESMLSDQENASIEVVVVSVDGKENDIVNSVLNMRAKDYSFVVAEVAKVVDGDVPEKKENSSETSTTKSSPEISK